jgi:integrase
MSRRDTVLSIPSVVVRKARTVTLPDGTTQITPEEMRGASNAEINRELAHLKRAYNLAIQAGKLLNRPHIPMLREAPARSGFFEREQYESVVKHLPEAIQPIITFAYVTSWRVASEILPIQWRNVDFDAGEVRLDAGTTKNGEGRTFPMTSELRTLLEARKAERDAATQRGIIAPPTSSSDS